MVRSLGWESFAFDPLYNPEIVIYGVLIAGLWQGTGLIMCLMLAGLRGSFTLIHAMLFALQGCAALLLWVGPRAAQDEEPASQNAPARIGFALAWIVFSLLGAVSMEPQFAYGAGGVQPADMSATGPASRTRRCWLAEFIREYFSLE